MSSQPGSRSVVVGYQLGGCNRDARPVVAETESSVTISVEVTKLFSGGSCPSDFHDERATARLGQRLGQRTIEHGP